MLASRTAPPEGDDDLKSIEMCKTLSPIGTLALVLTVVAPIVVRAEIISIPPATPSEAIAMLPPPTVLRGRPPAMAKAAPICPPGYTLSPDRGCIPASGGAYTEGSPGYEYWPGYDYWPGYGFGYPLAGFTGFRHGASRFHHFAGSHGFHGLRGPHPPGGFHGAATYGGRRPGAKNMGGGRPGVTNMGGMGLGIGPMGGLGRR
jgi:hypothetical protein